ncbi:MAG TPA: retropepsin-like aspartic protease [Candidatus Limnocylindria bacterium]|nr:retropepsin-like aspartic protease [Candidatus Limnocylindria bacterium]
MSLPRWSIALILLTLLGAEPAAAQKKSTSERPATSDATQLYSAPDDTSLPAGSLAAGEVPTPIAETLGAGGNRWHLVKTKSGLVGWIKQSDSDQSKKLGNFFKSLPQDDIGVALPVPNAAAPRGVTNVPVRFAGRAAIVTALLNNNVNANLILDTGATVTVISRRIASLLSLRLSGSMMGHTVGGPISAPVARLGSLKVGTAEVSELSVIVHNFSPHPGIDGLLGMDFLGQFQIRLDSQKQLLGLLPK